MPTLSNIHFNHLCARVPKMPDRKDATRGLFGTKRAGLAAGLALATLILPPVRNAQQGCVNGLKPECPALGLKTDLAFMLDRSGSLAIDKLGQTYNVQIEGILRALRDPAVIPRDGSTAIAILTFSENATVQKPLTLISSAADAEEVATVVEGLRCAAVDCTPTGACPFPGEIPGTNYGNAIDLAFDILSENRRPGARQVMLLSSDGQLTDPGRAKDAAAKAKSVAEIQTVSLELDLILMGLDDQQAPECSETAAVINQLVFSTLISAQSACDLPGAALRINKGVSNGPCASLTDSAVQTDFARQVKEFADHTRNVLRSPVVRTALVVNTEVDPPPATPVTGNVRSLRQAIEEANCNGGTSTITFACNVRTILPLVPLPALAAPEITLDGIAGREGASCPPVTIDGSLTVTPKDENGGLSDGISMRSNRGVVRGLRIVRFNRAGVAIDPLCVSDNTMANRIELNTLENNGMAGVAVKDPRPDPKNAVSHNVGNTISMNNISASGTPIDLSILDGPALDGPTANDPDDIDEGPNRLLNFPERLAASALLDVVTLSGQISASGAVIEIFAITGFRSIPGGRVIDGVRFLAQTKTDANGAFSVSGLLDSPTCGYTATVTDLEGNTSELMFPCGGFPKANVTPKVNDKNVDFGEGTPNQRNPRTGEFTIENVGCAPLDVHFDSIKRDGFPKKRNNDNGRFSIPFVGVGPGGLTITIQPGQARTFTAEFDLTIPRFPGAKRAPQAFETLPNIINSKVTFGEQRCGDNSVGLTGRVTTEVHLIDPENPRNSPPVVTFARNGDELLVGYSVFDSDRSVNKVNYEFFKVRNNRCQVDEPPIPLELTDPDLGAAITARGIVIGQSFNVLQRFTRANKHPDAACVRVTVSDGTTTASATSLPANGLSVRSATGAQTWRGATIVRPAIKLSDGFRAKRTVK